MKKEKETRSLDNKTALIFGASSGIGLHIAGKLLAEGWKVYNASRTGCPTREIIDLITDVSQEGAIEAAFERVLKENAFLDAMIYCSGCSMAAPVEHVREEDYRYLFEVNFFGALSAIRHALPVMRNSGRGRIVLMSSMGGEIPIAFDAFYSASKAALDMLAMETDMEVRPYNVYVTALQAGGTATEFTFKRKVYSDEHAGVYAGKMNLAVNTLAEIEQNGMAPERVADCVLNLLRMKNPPVITSPGAINKAIAVMGKILPKRVVRYLNRSVYFH